MSEISVELVPRTAEGLREELQMVKDQVPHVARINIPDLLRYEVRSWQGAAIAQEFFPKAMPHIRAIDIDLNKPLAMGAALCAAGIEEVLVIQGDPPQDMMRPVYPTVTTDVIRKFHEELPEIRVYAGIDPYRGSLRDEQYRIRRKLQAGAAGFFTQPFYDLRYLGVYADMLDGLTVYWGVSPVTSMRSKHYWELKNQTVFPNDFQPALDWNIDFSRRVLDFVEKRADNMYFMPIKTDLLAYLRGVLA